MAGYVLWNSFVTEYAFPVFHNVSCPPPHSERQAVPTVLCPNSRPAEPVSMLNGCAFKVTSVGVGCQAAIAAGQRHSQEDGSEGWRDRVQAGVRGDSGSEGT